MLLSPVESALRRKRLTDAMTSNGIDLALIQDNATKYYLTGRVFSGQIIINAHGDYHCFVRRPNHLSGQDTTMVRKPEEIPPALPEGFTSGCKTLGLEFATLNVNDFNRLRALWQDMTAVDLSASVREARSVKTDEEITRLTQSGLLHAESYSTIPQLFRPGMTDIEFQIEVERRLRLKGCLGIFRISGDSMEIFMGNILSGDNADSPTPYDFAMGGGGMEASLPVGANGSEIVPGDSVMVDANGNFTGYMTDMTRTYAYGTLSPLAMLAHQTSIEICHTLADMARPGVKASLLYETAIEIATKAGLEEYFMGHRQKAGFVGHGLGIEINEAPVLAPRSRDILQKGNVFALEPKFVIPGTGAVGIENTYCVMENGAAKLLTPAPEEILPLGNY